MDGSDAWAESSSSSRLSQPVKSVVVEVEAKLKTRKVGIHCELILSPLLATGRLSTHGSSINAHIDILLSAVLLQATPSHRWRQGRRQARRQAAFQREDEQRRDQGGKQDVCAIRVRERRTKRMRG